MVMQTLELKVGTSSRDVKIMCSMGSELCQEPDCMHLVAIQFLASLQFGRCCGGGVRGSCLWVLRILFHACVLWACVLGACVPMSWKSFHSTAVPRQLTQLCRPHHLHVVRVASLGICVTTGPCQV
jgi:hypothetical protein